MEETMAVEASAEARTLEKLALKSSLISGHPKEYCNVSSVQTRRALPYCLRQVKKAKVLW